MPRTPRQRSETGFYHVTLRGNGKQLLFETGKDRAAFIKAARSSFMRSGISLIAWCLMGNHVHLIIDDPHGRTNGAIHRISSSYASYFNHTFGHTGHVFEGRFGNVAIRDDGQLRAAVRYVHDNPLKGMGISPDRYPWSSYPEYASGTSTYADIDNLLDLLGGTQGFRTFSERPRAEVYRPAFRAYVDADERDQVARDVLESFGCTAADVKGLPSGTRDRVLKALCDGGLTVRYIQRMAGIGEWAVRKAAGRIKKR